MKGTRRTTPLNGMAATWFDIPFENPILPLNLSNQFRRVRVGIIISQNRITEIFFTILRVLYNKRRERTRSYPTWGGVTRDPETALCLIDRYLNFWTLQGVSLPNHYSYDGLFS